MSGWSTSSTTIFAARRVLPPDLIVAGPGVGAAHERHGPDACPPFESGSVDARTFDRLMPAARPAAEDHPLVRSSSRIDSIVVVDLRMKHAEHCGFSSKPTLNQTGELNAAIWCSSTCVSSASKVSASASVAK